MVTSTARLDDDDFDDDLYDRRSIRERSCGTARAFVCRYS